MAFDEKKPGDPGADEVVPLPQGGKGADYKVKPVVNPPYFSYWAKDTDDYTYDNYKPVAPADFPPPPEDDKVEVVVPEEDIGDGSHTSFFSLLSCLFFLLAFAALVVLAALACDTLDWCGRRDYSVVSDIYRFRTFDWLIPTEFILAAMAVGLFGLAVVSYYAFSVIRRDCGTARMIQIATYIRQGAERFLLTEYSFLLIAVVAIAIVLIFTNDSAIIRFEWRLGICYVIGALLSGLTGYIGMAIATRGNVRTTAAAEQGISEGLNVAFRSGAVMGISVVSVGITGLGLCYLAFGDVRALAGFSAGASTIALFARVGGGIYTKAADVGADLVGKVESSIPEDDPRNPATIADNVGDNVGDVAGMGADLFESFVGSIIATAILGASVPYFFNNQLAMCVYQHLNVDIQCGSFTDPPDSSSFANFICLQNDFYQTYPVLTRMSSQTLFVLLPFAVAMVGVGASILCSPRVFYFGDSKGGASIQSLLMALNLSIGATAVIITVATFGLTFGLFGPRSEFLSHRGFGEGDLEYFNLQEGAGLCQSRLDGVRAVNGVEFPLPNGDFRPGFYRPFDPIGFKYPPPRLIWVRLWGCIIIGLVLGIAIGEITQYFTAGNHTPTQGIAGSGEYGAGAVVIQGLGVGMGSAVLPLLLVFGSILGTYALFGSYGIGLAAVGMLSSLGLTMATDAYGPVADNAGGIAEMAELPPHVRDTTDALDALGNTTAAIGKGFSNGSAVLTAYALLTALVQDSGLLPGPTSVVGGVDGTAPESFVFDADLVSLVNVYVITSLLLGIMLPFLFGALTMLAVSSAAEAMIVEVRRQFRDIPGLREGKSGVRPEHERCIRISTISALWEMVLPGLIAIMSPIIIGFGFGQRALVGLLLGAIGSGYMLGIMMSNAGGAWDNAKKLVESGFFGKGNAKGSEWHKATVAGDTVGDPFKDTSGPSMNILIKMMTVFGLIFVPKMRTELTRGWIGLVVLGATLLLSLFFAIIKVLRGRKQRVEARKPPPPPKDLPPVAPSAKSPFIEPGPGLNVSKMPRNSALYNAYKTAGGQSGALAGTNGDVFNYPGLGYGTKEPMAVPDIPDEPDIVRAKGPQFDPRYIENEETRNAPPPLNKKDN